MFNYPLTTVSTDENKQGAMNLFLGKFLPYEHSVNLWDMPSDYFLHYEGPSRSWLFPARRCVGWAGVVYESKCVAIAI